MLNHEIRFAILCMMGNIDVEKFNLQEAIKTECVHRRTQDEIMDQGDCSKSGSNGSSDPLASTDHDKMQR